MGKIQPSCDTALTIALTKDTSMSLLPLEIQKKQKNFEFKDKGGLFDAAHAYITF